MLLTYAFREISGCGAYTPVMSCEGIFPLFVRSSLNMYLMKLVSRFLLKHEPILFLQNEKKKIWRKELLLGIINAMSTVARLRQTHTHTDTLHKKNERRDEMEKRKKKKKTIFNVAHDMVEYLEN